MIANNTGYCHTNKENRTTDYIGVNFTLVLSSVAPFIVAAFWIVVFAPNLQDTCIVQAVVAVVASGVVVEATRFQ